MATTVTLRDVTPKDSDFLFEVYASTRQEEMALLDWQDGEKDAFLHSQFHAQHIYYRDSFAEAAYQVILADRVPCGRFYVDRRKDEIRIIDIALLPEWRNRGIGTSLLCDLLDEARRTGLPVTIHVERYNPALSLYRRLGFRAVEGSENGVYLLMRWSPEGGDNGRAGYLGV